MANLTDTQVHLLQSLALGYKEKDTDAGKVYNHHAINMRNNAGLCRRTMQLCMEINGDKSTSEKIRKMADGALQFIKWKAEQESKVDDDRLQKNVVSAEQAIKEDKLRPMGNTPFFKAEMKAKDKKSNKKTKGYRK